MEIGKTRWYSKHLMEVCGSRWNSEHRVKICETLWNFSGSGWKKLFTRYSLVSLFHWHSHTYMPVRFLLPKSRAILKYTPLINRQVFDIECTGTFLCVSFNCYGMRKLVKVCRMKKCLQQTHGSGGSLISGNKHIIYSSFCTGRQA